MNSTKELCFLFAALVIGSALCCVTGCNAHVGGQENTAAQSSPHLAVEQQASADGIATVRFVAEPTEAPDPSSEGSFVDERHAWVTGSDLLRTTDGGRTWQLMRPLTEDEPAFGKLDDMFVRPYFISPMRGWLMAGRGTWQTEDGGQTWRRIFPTRSAVPYFATAQHGWMNVYTESSASEQSYVTQDGGATWQPCGQKRSFDRQTPHNAYFLTPQHGWAITSHTDDARQTIYGVARTVNGGCDWQQIWTSDENPDERYRDIHFINEREGWLAGEYRLYHTADGGEKWQEVLLPTEDVQLSSVYFADPNNGWVIVAPKTDDDTGIYRTADGGKTWRQLTMGEITSSGRGEIPAEWKAGNLLQMLYDSQRRN